MCIQENKTIKLFVYNISYGIQTNQTQLFWSKLLRWYLWILGWGGDSVIS